VAATEPRVARPSGDGGEAGLWVLGGLHTIMARGDTYTLIESATPPGGGMPPYVHHTQDEAIFVLEGEFVLVGGNEESTMGPGSFASVPKGTVHTLKKSAGDRMGRSLAIFTPPGVLEQFLQEIGVPVVDRSNPVAPPSDAPEMEEVVASARRHGIYVLTRPV
jgi:mannose-6-phosphate isomerase-like protein (cupin superfamily)